jgi:hypothetical protein
MFNWLRHVLAKEPEPEYPCIYHSDGSRLFGGNHQTIESAGSKAIRESVDRTLNVIDGGDEGAMLVIRRDPGWRLIISGHGRRRYAACMLEEQIDVSHWWCGPGSKDEDPYKTALPTRHDVHALASAFMEDPKTLAARPVWWESNPP